MIEKRNVEAFLKVNGIPATAKDEEIRSVLLSARWDNNEVDTALMILRENTKNKQSHVDSMHKVFNTDDRLSSSEISKLLGIDVHISDSDVGDINKKHKSAQSLTTVATLVLSVIIAISALFFMMYQEEAGFFHVDKTNASHAQ